MDITMLLALNSMLKGGGGSGGGDLSLLVYKWSEIKDDVQTFIMAIGENLQNGVVPSIFQDDPSFSGLQAGLYTFSVSSDGPAFNCMFFEYSSVTMATILIADADGDNPSFEIHYARFDATIDPE